MAGKKRSEPNRVYTATQVENGLLKLYQEMEAKFVMWARLAIDCVRQHVPEGMQQEAAARVIGMPLERIRADVLGMVLKAAHEGLPDGLPDEEPVEEPEAGFFA